MKKRATSTWKAQCFACGETELTVAMAGSHDDDDRIGLRCPTCGNRVVIATEAKMKRGKTK